jgi:hypothetical protein
MRDLSEQTECLAQATKSRRAFLIMALDDGSGIFSRLSEHLRRIHEVKNQLGAALADELLSEQGDSQ